ncbi:SLBB domain-containing protein [Granulicella mallensis]|uniref:Protein involved in polysaccharide export with SLBB domain n=1 Tax=Granulicella mallensis TaxID=940614 RepID=A0A7W7ZW55_9BACT|nr:SLBB domain-containing protein [Granulicella mallensis]MBB5066371.1 protein involved in polysaccharide export with SLBB domain [Granulicella mallensis]
MTKQTTVRWVRRSRNLMLCLTVFAAMCGLLQAQQQPSTPTGAPPTDGTAGSSSSSSTGTGFGLGLGLGSSASSSDATDSDSTDTQNTMGASSTDLSTGLGSSSSLTSHDSLTAAEIDDILQQRPELVPELKQLIADQLQQQGTAVQADSITDDMLYRQIATSPSLRASITQWMLSRGYISEDDLHRSLAGADVDQRSTPGLDSLATLPGAGLGSGAFPTSPTTDSTSSSTSISSTSSGSTMAQRTGPLDRRRNITDAPAVLRVPAPYNLLAMRDLYTQIPQDDTKLRRFGSDVFLNRANSTAMRASGGQTTVPLDLPVGPDYVLGPGDGLTINLWGGLSQSLTRVVDREGKIILPEAGALVVAGMTLEHAQASIQSALKSQFRDARIDVTVARLRTLRVYVVGDVQRPGAYDLSSLSTPLNALYAAGGPTSVGSLRTVRHYRGGKLVNDVDLYDFLLHGVRIDGERLESGDTLLIPPAGAEVAIYGMVKRPAIYEMKIAADGAKPDSTLAEMLDDAGGATVAAALDHITVERIKPNQERETITLDPAAAGASNTPEASRQGIKEFHVKDGDRIHVGAILPYSEHAIYVEGHVVRPGKYPYRDGMKLGDVIHSYQDLLPEPAAKGDIIRLVPPDLHAETIEFDVADAMIGNSTLTLQPFDTIRIFGRYEVDSPQVVIRGEVLRPGQYALSEGMTAAQLVKMAGGFKRDALLESADLTSYTVQGGKKVVSDRTAIGIGAAVQGNDRTADVPLKAGDILTVHQISGWSDIGSSIKLNGEVTYPGSYGLQEGERLSSVLRRAGGFRGTAYPDGAVLIRTGVKELEEKSRDELIRQIESQSVAARVPTSLNPQNQGAILQAAQAQQTEILKQLRTQPVVGRMVIHVSADIDSWANTPDDIEMRRGDVLSVPKRPGFVLVTGQVYNGSAITFVPGKEASWYLRRAGGVNGVANKSEIFIIRANGIVVGKHSGEWYSGNVLSTHLNPGDVIVVPQKVIGSSIFWQNLLTVAQLSSSIAITAAVAGLL